VRPAEGQAHLLQAPGQGSIAAKAIDLQDAGEVTEMGLGPLALAVSGIDIGHHRRIFAAPWSIVAGIGPELAGLGPTAPGIEHRRRRLVGEQPLGSSQSLQDVISQGAQIPGCLANPVGQGRAIELDVLAGVDLGLAV